jgi:glutathione reductase (NADPH)
VSFDFDLFVIGGGSAGVRCGRIAAGHGARVAVAEERFWGGTCVNVGCVPKKLMVMASEYGAMARDSRGFGWSFADGTHDWRTLIANKDVEISRLNGIYRRLLNNAGAKIFEAHATFLDAHTLEVGGQRVTAEKIVIATGGHPRRPTFRGAEHCIISDDAFFLPERPRRVVMLGGGYIALEFAGIFAGLGSEVDLVYRGNLPLRGFDEDLRTGVVEALEAEGIRLHPAVAPPSIEVLGNGKRAHLRDGSVVDADLVFAAIGRLPNVAGLGLERAGVATGHAGAVLVDGQGRTNRENIFAIGDVTDRLNLTPVATAEGHALADALFGPGPRVWTLDRVATAVFSSPPLATVGLTEHQAAQRGPADIYLSRFTPMRHALTGRARKTMMKLVVDQKTQKVVGAHMLGEDAPEIIQGLSIAINCGATKADFDRTVGIHPTAAEEFVTLRTRTRVAEASPDTNASPLVAPEEIGAAEMGVGV